jgi:hypothetical protein
VHSVKLEYSKKIKKEKKVNELKIKGEKYEIESWAACDKCSQWRKVSFKVREHTAFKCGDIGKQCNVRERVGKEYITL